MNELKLLCNPQDTRLSTPVCESQSIILTGRHVRPDVSLRPQRIEWDNSSAHHAFMLTREQTGTDLPGSGYNLTAPGPNPLYESGIPGEILHSMERHEVPYLIDHDLKETSDRYLTWLNNDVFLTFKSTKTTTALNLISGRPYSETEVKYLVRRCAKRGNSQYIKAVKERIDTQLSKIPNIVFFRPQRGKNIHKTKCLFFVLTTAPAKVNYSRYYAWENIGKELNRFIAGLRRYLKLTTTRTIRSWECFYKKAEGYPHVNLLVYMDKEVLVKKHIDKPDMHGQRRISYRLFNYRTKEEINKYWPWGFIDVQGVSRIGGSEFEEELTSMYGEETDTHIYDSVFSLAHATKYLTKNIRSEEVNDKVVLLNSVLWAMRKRTFSLGNWKLPNVKEIIADLTKDMDNSNKNVEITYKFRGIIPACIKSCTHGGKPPPDLCPYLIENRENGILRDMCPKNPDLESMKESQAEFKKSNSGGKIQFFGELTSSKCPRCHKFIIHNMHEMFSFCDTCKKEQLPSENTPVSSFFDIIKSGNTNPSDIMGIMVSRGIPASVSEHILDKALQEGRCFMPHPGRIEIV